jgi:hypothetical protein
MNEDRDSFALSNFCIGKSVTVVSPQLEGQWMDMRIVHTADPCLPGDMEWMPFVPVPFPELVCLNCIIYELADMMMKVIGI